MNPKLIAKDHYTSLAPSDPSESIELFFNIQEFEPTEDSDFEPGINTSISPEFQPEGIPSISGTTQIPASRVSLSLPDTFEAYHGGKGRTSESSTQRSQQATSWSHKTDCPPAPLRPNFRQPEVEQELLSVGVPSKVADHL